MFFKSQVVFGDFTNMSYNVHNPSSYSNCIAPVSDSPETRNSNQFPEPVWHDDVCDAMSSRREIPVNVDSRYPVCEWMITGRTKWNNFASQPYSSYYALFRRLAFTSERWLIIGYSGGDSHVNVVLRDALKYRRAAGLPISVGLIDMTKNPLSLFRRIFGEMDPCLVWAQSSEHRSGDFITKKLE
ncbi:hypothetical protein SAMN05421543_1573 [Alicyclobacillus macrosporangiidus]|uniref:SIR2-like domain-containing protein n=1 Tax=Alicyclobacillus macrosporangiidus TaxID=392015 RepID=A0A1I7LI74_9BACL|nr:hypothetical protein SAMN05421543_1573 [Alicyclobacillus macrosporangiidus]